MAGKRQHYIPQFLQRGFLADHAVDVERTWLHRKGAAPKLVGIKDVGVGEYFYSRASVDGSPTLDDLITGTESNVVADLKMMRLVEARTKIDCSVASRLVTHLTFRTAHLRSTLTQGALLVVDQVAEYVGSSDRMREELGVDGVRPGRDGLGLIEKMLSSVPVQSLSLPPELAKRAITFFVRERFDEMYEQTKPQLVNWLSSFGQGISNMVQVAHKKVLSNSDLSKREQSLAVLTWRTQEVSGALLPDCITLVRESDGGFVPLLLSNLAAVDCVILPIAHDRLLVGMKSDCSEEIPVSVVNEASAACSDSFFISRHPSEDESLSSHIGQRCAQAIEAHIGSALSNARGSDVQSDGFSSTADAGCSDFASGPLSFTLTCIGFGDEEVASKLSKAIRSIALEIGRDMPLSSLDGVTFSTDYVAAVEQMSRGDVSLAAEGSRPRDYGYAVAKCIRVFRDGLLKEHIVFDAVVGRGLLDEQVGVRADAVHLTVNMMSHVAHKDLFEEKLRREKVVPPDDVAGLLHPCVSSVPGMYFSARQSAFAAPSAGNRFATLTLDSYTSLVEAARLARLAYLSNENVDDLLHAVLPRVAFVLEHAAQWLGHRDGLPEQDPSPGVHLTQGLKALDLDLWLELFGRDLQCLYASDDQFSMENVFRLGRHAERLLWTLRIFPWPMQCGGTYVSVPLCDEEQALKDRFLKDE